MVALRCSANCEKGKRTCLRLLCSSKPWKWPLPVGEIRIRVFYSSLVLRGLERFAREFRTLLWIAKSIGRWSSVSPLRESLVKQINRTSLSVRSWSRSRIIWLKSISFSSRIRWYSALFVRNWWFCSAATVPIFSRSVSKRWTAWAAGTNLGLELIDGHL